MQDHTSYSLIIEGSVLQGALGIFVVRSISPAQSVWGMSAQLVQERLKQKTPPLKSCFFTLRGGLQAVPSAEREGMFAEHMAERERKDREARKAERRRRMDAFRALLEATASVKARPRAARFVPVLSRPRPHCVWWCR